jgi:hypothetical protein
MSEVTIVCPTHGRAGEVTAFAIFGEELLLCVAESQAPAYREAHPQARLDVHPDSVVGLGPKMTWMYEKYGAMFRVDDDAHRMIDHTDSTRVEPAKAVGVVQRLADQAEQVGAYLFGLTSDENPMHFSPQSPFRVTGLVDGGKLGLLPGSQLWWPEDIAFADDFWVSMLNAYHHRFCLVDERYCIATRVGQQGGLASVRTQDAIWTKAQFLRDSFGDACELKDKGDVTFTYPWRGRVPWR